MKDRKGVTDIERLRTNKLRQTDRQIDRERDIKREKDVVYFDKQLGTVHSERWLKSPFSMVFSCFIWESGDIKSLSFD